MLLGLPLFSQSNVCLWDFNSSPSDANVGTGLVTPLTGTGALTLIGGTTSTFATGNVSDPNTSDNSGLNVTTWPAQGTNPKTAGVQFDVSTTGFNRIGIEFWQRLSNTVANTWVLQYTLDNTGASTGGSVVWTDATTYTFTPQAALTPDVSCNTPLPLELISFEGNREDKVVELNWKTATENNTASFHLQRSVDGKNFQAISTIAAAGFSTSLLSYHFQDNNVFGDIIYYKLLMEDRDGQTGESEVIQVNSKMDQKIIYPNPAKDIVYARGWDEEKITVIDPSGTVVLSELYDPTNGISIVNLKKGLYFVRSEDRLYRFVKE